MDPTLDATILKLILLFVMEKMEIPLTSNSILDICSSRNNWINYMECKDIIFQLQEADFIYKTDPDSDEVRFALTYSGRNCLAHFYQRIPSNLRDEIIEYTKENRLQVKRSQEYIGDYFKNTDGSYTIVLKIRSPLLNESMFEIRVKAPSRQSAIESVKKWRDKAPNVYEYIFETLVDI